MKAGFIQDLAKKYVYYLTFLLNPEERTKSTILTKVEKYKEFTGIFDELPTKLTKGQEVVYNVFKSDDIRVGDLKDLLEDHFKNDIRDFFKLLKSRDLEIGDLFLHDNYWLASPDCVGKECYEHSIDNLNSGKYLCKVYEECNDHECLKYLKIDIRNTIKAKMAKKRIDLYKGITTTNDDVNSFLNMFKNSKECASLDEEQQSKLLEHFNDMLSTNDTVEQIVEDVFYKDGKNYNCECYDNSDSDSDNESDIEDNLFSKSFKKAKRARKEMKGGNKRTKYSNYTHHDYDETHIRKIEREIIEQFKNINYLGLTTQDILKTSTKNWRDEVFRGGKKQMGGIYSDDDDDDSTFEDALDDNDDDVVFSDTRENDEIIRKEIKKDITEQMTKNMNTVLGSTGVVIKKQSIHCGGQIMNTQTCRWEVILRDIDVKSIDDLNYGVYGKDWVVYTNTSGKKANLIIDSIIRNKIRKTEKFNKMNVIEVYNKIIENNKQIDTVIKTQKGLPNSMVLEIDDRNIINDTVENNEIHSIILKELPCSAMFSSRSCKWKIILEPESNIEYLSNKYGREKYGKKWKFYTVSEEEETNLLIDTHVKSKIFNYYSKLYAKNAAADVKKEDDTHSLSDSKIMEIFDQLVLQGVQLENIFCPDEKCSVIKLRKNELEDGVKEDVCDSVSNYLASSKKGKFLSTGVKKACAFKSNATSEFKRLMEEALQEQIPVTNTFAEMIWYNTIYHGQKYIRENVKDKIIVDDETREKYTEWLSTKGEDTSTWTEYGKATWNRAGKIWNKTNVLTEEGQKAWWARGQLLISDTMPWIATFLLMLLKHPRMLRLVLDALVKIKIRLCNNLKISRGNIVVVSKPKTLEEEIQELLKSVNIWALSYVPPAFKHIETGINLIRAFFLFGNSITKALTVGFLDLESWIIWIFGIIILSSKDMAEELIQSMILYDNLNSIIQLFDIIGCLHTPYCLNIAPTRRNLSIELYDPNDTYDYTFDHFFKNDNNLKSIFNNNNWFPRTYNEKYYKHGVVRHVNKNLSEHFATNIDNFKLVITDKNYNNYLDTLTNNKSLDGDFSNERGIQKDVGKIKSKCFWCTNDKGEFIYLFRGISKLRPEDAVKDTKSTDNYYFSIPFKGSTFDIENVNINYYSGNIKDYSVSTNFVLTGDTDKNKSYIETDKAGNITKLIYEEKKDQHLVDGGYNEITTYYELDPDDSVIVGQDNIPATINNFDRLIMELAGTNPITCPDGKATLKKEQIKMAGLKMPLGWYNHADKKLFQNKYRYGISTKDNKIYIKFLNHRIWGDLFNSAFSLHQVVQYVKSNETNYNYGKENWNIMMSIMLDKLKAANGVLDTAYQNIFGNRHLWKDMNSANEQQMLNNVFVNEIKEYIVEPKPVPVHKPMYEEYFLIFDLNDAANKNVKDILAKNMKEAQQGNTSFIVDLYVAIAFKIKPMTGSTEIFEVTDFYLVPKNTEIHSIATNSNSNEKQIFECAINKCIYEAFHDNFTQESKKNPGITYVEFDLYAVFDFVHYDMHSEIGEKYKIKDMDYKHPADQAQIINALNILLDNTILYEQSTKKYSNIYFPKFNKEQAINAMKKKWFVLENWTNYFKNSIYPQLKKQEKSMATMAADTLKSNFDTFTKKGVNDFKWINFTEKQIKELSKPDAQRIYDEASKLSDEMAISYVLLDIYRKIGTVWIKPEDTIAERTVHITLPQYAYDYKDDQKYVTPNDYTNAVNLGYLIFYQDKLSEDNYIVWKTVKDSLTQNEVFARILNRFGNNLNGTDAFYSVLGIKLNTMKDVNDKSSSIADEINRLTDYIRKFDAWRTDIKEHLRIHGFDIATKIRKMIHNKKAELSIPELSSNMGGNKHKNTKRNYNNVPDKKSNRYTRRILYQDTHYNTQA